MTTPNLEPRKSVTDYCAKIGMDPLLVQGAGGNVSWKENETLWIKASGTWLAKAATQNIFVPVDLKHLRQAITAGDFNVSPQVTGESSLRPSIETLLHALMPHSVVVHLHAIEVLAHLVRADFENKLQACLGDQVNWVNVGYCKPGAPLAEAIFKIVSQKNIQVIFLQNHGIVIGGENVDVIHETLQMVTSVLACESLPIISQHLPAKDLKDKDAPAYFANQDLGVQQLALNSVLFDQLSNNWALYPDHVVFLGPKPHCFESVDQFFAFHHKQDQWPELVFIRNVGVYVTADFNSTKQTDLECYYQVLARQPAGTSMRSLSEFEIAELLNWDAERYRISLSKEIS